MFLLLHHQALQLHCLKVLPFSTTSFHLTKSWMHFVQLFIFIIFKSSFVSFSHLIFYLPANLVDSGVHSYNFLAIVSLSFDVLGQTSLIFGTQYS